MMENRTRESKKSVMHDFDIKKDRQTFLSVQETRNEFTRRRKLIVRCMGSLSKKPLVKAVEIIKEKYGGQEFYQVDDKGNVYSATIIFEDEVVAKEAVAYFRVKLGLNYTISYFSNSSLMFVGNIPENYTRSDLYKLFHPYGEILRCLVVYNEKTGESKGYGFVEFITEGEALAAKFALAKKRLQRRKLRVDFASMRMITYPDIHSRTLFVDCLPRTLASDVALLQFFSKYGTVNFCQVAIDQETRKPRQFAFVDMATSSGAEIAHQAANKPQGAKQAFRASYGMPCRPGASILQNNISEDTLKYMQATLLNCSILKPPVSPNEDYSDDFSDSYDPSLSITPPSISPPRSGSSEFSDTFNESPPYQMWTVKPHEQGIQYIDPLVRIMGVL